MNVELLRVCEIAADQDMRHMPAPVMTAAKAVRLILIIVRNFRNIKITDVLRLAAGFVQRRRSGQSMAGFAVVAAELTDRGNRGTAGRAGNVDQQLTGHFILEIRNSPKQTVDIACGFNVLGFFTVKQRREHGQHHRIRYRKPIRHHRRSTGIS